jgi:BirA family transcriptional regulator, biotin operon repressor / biotin---[acetyl-CoA-carboxylase] ligase
MMSNSTVLSMYDETPCDELQRRADSPRLIAVDRCSSTMDVAHQMAQDGAPHGSVVVADEQGAGRGRTGKTWHSPRASGVWASVLLRTPSASGGGVLSLRTGIELAQALESRAAGRIQLKWPNDLLIHGRKLAGVLTEARWRGDQLEWIVVGVGVNVRQTGADAAAALSHDARRSDVLVDVVRSVMRAAAMQGELDAAELERFAARDIAIGRDVDAPLVGTVLGVTARGGVRIRTETGDAVAVAGSLVFRSPLAE